MKKEILIVIILFVIILVLSGFLMLPVKKESGIEIFDMEKNQKISSPLIIEGRIKGMGWTGFEGQTGTVKLQDSTGKVLGQTYLKATTDWMAPEVYFKADLSFVSDIEQKGILIFHNENASGMPEKDREFVLPVKILKSQPENVTIKVYFSNNKMDPEISCNKVFAVERSILKIEAIGSAALWQLLMGPTEEEKSQGFYTSINEGVKLQGLMIGMESGTAMADFNERLEYQVGGSCRVSAIRAQISETLKQFPTIKDVIISINGRKEDILQP
jgi:hypothetical protein